VNGQAGQGAGIVNTVQAERWNGDSGLHWIANMERNETRHRLLVRHLHQAARVAPGEHVLDVGCGCGATTIATARAAAGPARGATAPHDAVEPPAATTAGMPASNDAEAGGSAHGLDLSAPMLEVARRRAADGAVANVTFEHGDAQVHPLRGDFYDVAISSFGVMFFDDPAAAFANITAALRPHGRMAFLCWQNDAHNELFAIPAQAFPAEIRPVVAAGAELFADPAQITELLSGAGCANIGVEPISEPAWMGTDVADVMAYSRGMRLITAMIAELGDDKRAEEALAAIAATYAARQRPDGVWVNAAAWLVTANRD
jgi:ubiquinone/menaquinone biosynthesis C-methylase UbiE